MWQKIVTLYAANGKFHAFVGSIAIGLGTGVSVALVGGIPLNKQGWIVAGGVVLGALKAAITGWLRNNVAIASVQGTGATVAQTKAVASTAQAAVAIEAAAPAVARDRVAEAAAASVAVPPAAKPPEVKP